MVMVKGVDINDIQFHFCLHCSIRVKGYSRIPGRYVSGNQSVFKDIVGKVKVEKKVNISIREASERLDTPNPCGHYKIFSNYLQCRPQKMRVMAVQRA